MSLRGFLSKLKVFFGWKLRDKSKETVIQSDLNRFESMRIDAESITQSLNQSINRLNHPEILEDKKIISQTTPSAVSERKESKKSILLEEDSLKLGVAAGFVGRSLMNIEEQLSKIVEGMATKDWIASNLLSQINSLRSLLHEHEINEEKRFEAIMSAIGNLSSLAKELPEPYQTTLLSEVERIKKAQLTPKMKELLSIVEQCGEISYKELSERLGITQDALRGLLSRTIRLTNKIERFQRDGKGWVRFKRMEEVGDKNDSERFTSIQSLESLGDKKENIRDKEKEVVDLNDMP